MSGAGWGLAGLAAGAVGLLALTVATTRPPAAPPPGLGEYFHRWAALHGGYDGRAAVLPRVWLTLVYRAGRPLAARGVRPDVLTLWGLEAAAVVFAAAVPDGRWPLAAAAVVVGSGLLDTLDGAVAVLSDRVSRFGYVLDSLVDRLSDGLYLAAMWRLGAPAGLCVAAAAALGLLEYARARAGNAGMGEIGVVTVGERPTRVVVAAAALLCAGLFVTRQGLLVGLGAAATLGLCTVGLGQLIVVVRRVLADPINPQRPG